MSQKPSHGSGRRQRVDIAVLGMGQIGGSIALAGRAAGLFGRIVGFGRHPESLERARQLELCDRTTTVAAEAVADADIVVLATPLRAIPEIVDAIAPALRVGALVIDVGSVKGTAARDIEARLPSTVAFVGCHPLAGTEQFGPEAARVDLFEGRKCVVCPTSRTQASAIDRVRGLWEAMGAKVLTMTPDLHDQVMAAVSHLPHVAAYALAAALADLAPEIAQAAQALPTTSLRDTSRVAASSPAMWRDILLENRTALLPLIQVLTKRLQDLEQAIASGDDVTLTALLEAGRTARARLLPE
ncbi:MAG: prephenate dehydrogenase/arogenate dehydrogenase family protein [Deltaproteobacteria bacterium]|nr:prephenate dehydrogenase/arogenate dehydrogenase family protein [Deltaproteobacteria bacterium]